MRILMDQAVHDHRNIGNNALLQVSVARMREHFPGCRCDVLSIAPHFCRGYLANVRPVRPENLRGPGWQATLMHRAVPRIIWQALLEARERVYDRVSSVPKARRAEPPANQPSEREHARRAPGPQGDGFTRDRTVAVNGLSEALSRYDMYVATGGGYMCDSDKRFLMPLLDRLELAASSNVPAVMVGQGIGPLSDPETVTRAAQVLPRLDLILIREKYAAASVLEPLGVDPDRIIVTGDDAIELPYARRKAPLGTALGLSVRVSASTGMRTAHVDVVRRVVLEMARAHDVEVVAAPISYYRDSLDMDPIGQIVREHPRVSASLRRFETVEGLIRRVGRCRVMISGTCHGAVFALGQGIPVVAVANSEEYNTKLGGLSAEFGADACRLVGLDDPAVQEKLTAAVLEAWARAEDLRPVILAHAQRQIEMGRAAYRRVVQVVAERRTAAAV